MKSKIPVDYFKFEIRPVTYNMGKGTSQILHLQMNVNGEEYHNEKQIDLLDSIPNWQTTLQFYSHVATLALEEKLKELESK